VRHHFERESARDANRRCLLLLDVGDRVEVTLVDSMANLIVASGLRWNSLSMITKRGPSLLINFSRP
jgi:hypothetical protein